MIVSKLGQDPLNGVGRLTLGAEQCSVDQRPLLLRQGQPQWWWLRRKKGVGSIKVTHERGTTEWHTEAGASSSTVDREWANMAPKLWEIGEGVILVNDNAWGMLKTKVYKDDSVHKEELSGYVHI